MGVFLMGFAVLVETRLGAFGTVRGDAEKRRFWRMPENFLFI